MSDLNMIKLRKHIVIVIAAFAVLLSACYGTPDEQTEKGRAIMEDYLSEQDLKSYSVDTAYKELERPAPDVIEETCFVHGDYTVNGDRFEYWVNTDTGEIFTSEKTEEFRKAGYDLIIEKLGLDPADCKGTCDIISDSPRSWVVPVDTDGYQYIRDGFDAGNAGAAVWLAVKGSDITKDRWTLEDTSDWNESKAYIEIIADENEPFPDGFGIYKFNEWEGPKFSLSSESVEYTPGRDASAAITGTWLTASMGYEYNGTSQPEYYVQFTDSEINYGHMNGEEFELDHADKICSIDEISEGRYLIQAETSGGSRYTYRTSENDGDILEYYETWSEEEFPEQYRAGASLTRSSSKSGFEQNHEEDGRVQ